MPLPSKKMTIQKIDQEAVFSAFVEMLKVCETEAEKNDADPILRKKVENWYALLNRLEDGSAKKPRWYPESAPPEYIIYGAKSTPVVRKKS